MIRDTLGRIYAHVVDERTGSGWRIPALDGLRGVAALMVVVAHTRHQCSRDDSLAWAPIERGGLGGVVLFFALSGFLLYLPWLRSSLEHKPPPRFRSYALRRCLRIMPAYYVSVITLAVAHAVGHSPIGFVPLGLHFVFLQSLMTPLLPVYWTLQVEEYFYWVLPLLHRLVVRYGVWLLLSMSIALSAMWGLASLAVAVEDRGIWLVETPFFLPAFVLGIATAIAWKRSVTPSRSLVWLGIVVYLVMAPISLYLSKRYQDDRYTTIMELAMAPAASAVVLGVARSGSRFLEHPLMRFIGAISFSLYLWHQVVLRVPVPHAIVHAFLPRLALTLVISIAVALASYVLVERPFLRMRPSN